MSQRTNQDLQSLQEKLRIPGAPNLPGITPRPPMTPSLRDADLPVEGLPPPLSETEKILFSCPPPPPQTAGNLTPGPGEDRALIEKLMVPKQELSEAGPPPPETLAAEDSAIPAEPRPRQPVPQSPNATSPGPKSGNDQLHRQLPGLLKEIRRVIHPQEMIAFRQALGGVGGLRWNRVPSAVQKELIREVTETLTDDGVLTADVLYLRRMMPTMTPRRLARTLEVLYASNALVSLMATAADAVPVREDYR